MEVLYWFESMRNPVMTKIFELITWGGEEMLLLAIICVLYWCVNKEIGYRVGLVFFTSGLCIQTLKITFRIDRPWIKDTLFEPVQSALRTATGYSFPSGHTQASTACFGTFAYYNRNKRIWVMIVLLCIPVLVAISRMYLGVHTPADVITSFLVSGVIVIIINIVFDRIKTSGQRIVTCVVILCVAVAVVLYSYILWHKGIIDYNYVSDCCKSAGGAFGFAVGWYIESKFINFDEKKGSLLFQIIKLLVGVTVAMIIKIGLKYIIGSSIPADFIRYFILIMWAAVIYPLLIKFAYTRIDISKAKS